MDILEKARELGDLLREDPRCLRLQAAKAKNDLDGGLQKLIGEFNLQRMSLDRALKGEQVDAVKVNGYQSAIKALYAQIMAHPGMREYMAAKQEADALLSHISGILQAGVTGDPEPEPTAGCTGNCAGCAGCR